jgi:hypothetical protein
MKRTLALVFSAACVLSLASCGYLLPVMGSGTVATNEFQVTGFTSIDASNAMDVTVSIGNEYSCSVSCDDNLMGHLKVSVKGGALILGEMDLWSIAPTRMSAAVTMPAISSVVASGASKVTLADPDGAAAVTDINASGASKVTLGNMAVPRLSAFASGASEIAVGGLAAGSLSLTISGASNFSVSAAGAGGDSLNADVSGASRVGLFGYPAATAVMNVSGASRADINVSGSLSGTASGASEIRYRGGAASSVFVSGASSCLPAE